MSGAERNYTAQMVSKIGIPKRKEGPKVYYSKYHFDVAMMPCRIAANKVAAWYSKD